MSNKLVEKYNAMAVESRAALWFAICNCISSGISFLSMPFFTRLMSADQYGIVVVYNSWVQLFSVFATLNLSAGAFNNGMVMFADDRDGYSSSMQGLFATVNISTAMFALGIYFLFPNIIELPLEFIPIIFLQIFCNHIYALWCARQRYEYKYRALLGMTCIFSVAVTVLSVCVVALVTENSIKALSKVMSSACGGCIIAIALIFVTQKKSKHLYSKRYWQFALKFSIPLIPHYLSLIILGQIDRIMIASMIGEGPAAHYAVAYTIGMALSIIASALNSSIVPWQFEKIKRKDYDGLSTKASGMVMLLSIVGITVTLISPEILFVAAPIDYQDAVIAMPPVVMSVIFTFVYNVLSNYEFYFMANRFISIASMVAASANFVLNCIFIPVFGFVAAAYSTVACYCLLAISHTLFSLYICRKEVGKTNASKMLDVKTIWLTAGLAFLAIMGSGFVYPLPGLRYAIILALIVVLLIKRSELGKLLGKF